MNQAARERKRAAKQQRADGIVEQATRGDDKSGDEHRRMAAHAHVMTAHALEMDTPDAHEAAAAAHQQVADKHLECAEDCDDEEPVSSEPAPKKK